MKKFLILPILIAPMVANADNVGPAAASGTPVIATANAPYATANAETGDSTTVVSASYVKGAYNDAIAAVNKVNAGKQVKLINTETNDEISSIVLGVESFGDVINDLVLSGEIEGYADHLDSRLVSAPAIAFGIAQAFDGKRINAVTTWGSDNVTQLGLSNEE